MAGSALKYQFLKISGRTFVYIVIAIGLLITIFPILWLISTSFKPIDAAQCGLFGSTEWTQLPRSILREPTKLPPPLPSVTRE